MNPWVARQGRISIQKQDKERAGSQAEVIKLATLSQARCSRPPQPSHTVRCLDGRSDCYTLLQSDSCGLARSGGSAWIEPPQISPFSEKDIDSYCFSFTIYTIFCNIPHSPSHNKGQLLGYVFLSETLTQPEASDLHIGLTLWLIGMS